jgi:hypothetical protein
MLPIPLVFILSPLNDGSGHMAAGGTVSVMKAQHSSVRMADENLHIELPSGKVKVRYVFKNEGKATKVLMAFPEDGYMLPPDKDKRVKKGESLFGYFRSWVDGKPFSVNRVLSDKEETAPDFQGYKHWWVKEVPFAAGQTRVVVNEYQGGLGWGPAWTPERSFSYTLRTGSTWKGGKIGNLQVTVDARGLEGFSPQTWSPHGWKHTGGIWTMSRSNFKPEEDISVRWPDGFYNFTINGKKYPDTLYELRPPPPMKFSPIRSGNEVFVPIPLVKPLLGAMVSTGGGKLTLVRGSHRIAIVGRPSKGGTMLPLRASAKGLGGTSDWKGDRLEIRLK